MNVQLAENDTEAVSIFFMHKEKIGKVFAEFLKYKDHEVAIATRLLTDTEVDLSTNLDRINFVVDTAFRENAASLQAELLKQIPQLEPIKFGVTVRDLPNTSYSKHTPPNR